MVDGLDYTQVTDLSRRLRLASQLAPKRVDEWLHTDVGPAIAEEMRRTAPVDTGNLKNHIQVVSSPGSVRVGVIGVSYVREVVEGTRPHMIKAKGNALVFKINGRTIYARSVKHPGTKPNTFLQDSTKTVLSTALPRLAGLTMDLKRG